ncbi:MAG: hypothetical protein AB7O73_10830 [Bacteroidia bacterium]
MTKLRNDALFSLIKRMTKSEKWQFSVYSKNFREDNSFYYLVFQELNRQKEYDESQLQNIENIRVSQIPNIKVNLYKILLRFLSNNSKPVVNNISLNFQAVKILYNKCLYADALTLIEKGKQDARKQFDYQILLQLLELEKQCIIQTSDSMISERVDRIISEINEIVRRINNVNQFSNLALKLNSFYQTIGFIRNKEDLKMVRDYYEDNFPEVDLRKLSEIELVHLYHTVTEFYLFIQRFENAYKYAKKLLQVFEANQTLQQMYTELYIKAINYVLVSQNKLKLLAEFKDTHKKLTIIKRNKSLVSNQNIALNLFKAIYIQEINKHFMMGEFKQGTKVVAALEKEIDKFMTILNKNTILIFYYKIAALYFGSGQYKTAIKWLNKIINEKVVGLRDDILSFARILELICYYELDETEMVEYKIKSTYRFLLKRQNFIKYQLHIMNFLREMRRNQTKKELYKAFQDLKINMQSLQSNRFERRAFLYFDIISWLESKLEEKSIQEIIKEKYNIDNREAA